jgi:hypothetical protein
VEWRKIFSPENSQGQEEIVPVDSPKDANCILQTKSRWQLNEENWQGEGGTDHAGSPVLVWDSGDFPSGVDAGLYCSLPRPLFEPNRHRAFCYPIVYNECIEPFRQEEAENLFCFAGGITSGLRGRMVSWMQGTKFKEPVGLLVQGGPWQQMFDRSGLPVKKQYADMIKKSRFVLCPRGNGVGSIRLFEVLKSGRVPVVLSDDFVFPHGVDWASCSLVVRERDYREIPFILENENRRWPEMASAAQKISREFFEGPGLMKSLGQNLRFILENRRAQSLGHRVKIRGYKIRLQVRRKAGIILNHVRKVWKK